MADTCLQFHGGIGYMEETWTARYFRDSRLLSIGGGADEVMLRVLAQLEGIGGLSRRRSGRLRRRAAQWRMPVWAVDLVGPALGVAAAEPQLVRARPGPSATRFHTSQISSGGSHSSVKRTGSSMRSRCIS